MVTNAVPLALFCVITAFGELDVQVPPAGKAFNVVELPTQTVPGDAGKIVIETGDNIAALLKEAEAVDVQPPFPDVTV